MTEADPAGHDPPAPQFNEYVVVLRARSAAFLPEEGCEFNIAVPGLRLDPESGGPRLEAAPGSMRPRELIVEVRGPAPSLDEAVMKFATIARPIATMAGFVANVQVEAA